MTLYQFIIECIGESSGGLRDLMLPKFSKTPKNPVDLRIAPAISRSQS